MLNTKVFILTFLTYSEWMKCTRAIPALIVKHCFRLPMLQIKDLRVGQWKESYIVLTQENSIENSVQDCLLYILIPNGLCELFLAYPKWLCVCLKVNICTTHYMTSSLPECPMFFHVSCDLWLCHLMWPAVWQCDLVTLTLILALKIE